MLFWLFLWQNKIMWENEAHFCVMGNVVTSFWKAVLRQVTYLWFIHEVEIFRSTRYQMKTWKRLDVHISDWFQMCCKLSYWNHKSVLQDLEIMQNWQDWWENSDIKTSKLPKYPRVFGTLLTSNGIYFIDLFAI